MLYSLAFFYVVCIYVHVLVVLMLFLFSFLEFSFSFALCRFLSFHVPKRSAIFACPKRRGGCWCEAACGCGCAIFQGLFYVVGVYVSVFVVLVLSLF